MNILLLLILLIVVGALAWWGWNETSTVAPDPTATAFPPTMPAPQPGG
jgi:hypothetical protein